MRDIIMIGGPNGAGKTSAAEELVPRELNIREFVNADDIALGLSRFNPEGAAIAAGRLMIDRMKALVRNGESLPSRLPARAASTFLGCATVRRAGGASFFYFYGCPRPRRPLRAFLGGCARAVTPFRWMW